MRKLLYILIGLLALCGCEDNHQGNTNVFTANEGASIIVYMDADGNIVETNSISIIEE